MEQWNVFPSGEGDPLRLTRDTIARRLAEGLNPLGRSDEALEAMVAGGAVRPGRAAVTDRVPRPAAVLVPLVQHLSGMTVLLTQRTDHLYHHPGQISFPGGRLEECDAGDFQACALRETEEEVGLARHRVAVLGRLDDYFTGTGFIVTPVVGVVEPPVAAAPDPFEVAEVFEVPLAFLLDQANHALVERVVEGRARPFWSITWQGRIIWGATAGILVNLADCLRDA
jgi:8-oxo-dGTP pyrophosphatase MutT (NUDIX family)